MSYKNLKKGLAIMLHFKDGKFHAPGVSFAIPDGFFLDTETESQYEYGLNYFSPKQDIYFSIFVDEECGDIQEEMEELLEPGSGLYLQGAITPYNRNGLAGYESRYTDGEHDYYEARFQIPNGPVAVVIAQNERGTTVDLKEHPDVQAVMDTIVADSRRGNVYGHL